MSEATAVTCATCGASVRGKFCSECGAQAGPRTCPACQAPLSAHARFCHRCGQAAAGSARSDLRRAPVTAGAPRSERTAWIVAGVAVALLLLLIVAKVLRDRPAAATPDMANAGNVAPGGALATGRAPDISQLSPAERFLRLNNRIMDAAGRGDSNTVVNFTPMALGAYSQLDSITNDERYHAAVLHAQVGQVAEARALADTMLKVSPGYLLAYVVRGDLAEFEKNQPALHDAYTEFLKHELPERASRRAEYVDHAAILDEFALRAKAAK